MPGVIVRTLGGLLAALIAAAPVPVIAQDAKPLEVRFHSADPARTLINGLYFKSLKAGRRPGVIMLHGCAGMLSTSGKLRSRPRFWTRWLLDKGYAVLLADSFTPRGFGSICRMAERPVQPDRERPFDAYGALRFLQAQPGILPDRVALMGWSNGAMTLLWTLKTTAAQRPAKLAHDFRAAIAFYPGCHKLKRAPYRTAVPVLLQLGLADDWTPAANCLELADEAGAHGVPILLDAYEDAYHAFDNPSSVVRKILTRNGKSERHVHVGTNLTARNTAVINVQEFLARHLKP